jgi:outer membrane biosynthesis protein TonB
MSDTPKFTVIDRRKIKAEEEQENQPRPAEPVSAPQEPVSEPAAPSSGPRLVVNEHKPAPPAEEDLPQVPTAKESRDQKAAYDASAQRIEDMVRAQNPAVGAQPPVGFEHLVQQFYVSAMIQMGAGTQEGQRPRVDILGARMTIDLLGVLQEKTRGNLSESEKTTLETVLFDVRMAFLELTSMISLQAMQPPPPPPGKR